MNWIKAGKIALEVGAALLSGIAIFVGVDRAVKSTGRRNQANNQMPPKQQNGFSKEPSAEKTTEAPANRESNGIAPQKITREEKLEMVSNGLRATQETCTKIFSVSRDLVSIVDSFRRLFCKNNDGYPNPYDRNMGFGYGSPMESRGQTWTRVSPFIIEAGPGPYNGGGSGYGYGNF